jgi:hypothetical protein
MQTLLSVADLLCRNSHQTANTWLQFDLRRLIKHLLCAKLYLLVEELDFELKFRGRPPHVGLMMTGVVESCPSNWWWSSPSIESTGLLNEVESTDTWFPSPTLFLSLLSDNSFLLVSSSSIPNTYVESDILLRLEGDSSVLGSVPPCMQMLPRNVSCNSWFSQSWDCVDSVSGSVLLRYRDFLYYKAWWCRVGEEIMC